jgi:hypothetical protein
MRRVKRNPSARKPVPKRARKTAKKHHSADMKASLEALLRKISPRAVAPKKKKASKRRVKRARRNPSEQYVIVAETRGGNLFYDGFKTFTDDRARAKRYSDDRCRSTMRALVEKDLPSPVSRIRQEAV